MGSANMYKIIIPIRGLSIKQIKKIFKLINLTKKTKKPIYNVQKMQKTNLKCTQKLLKLSTTPRNIHMQHPSIKQAHSLQMRPIRHVNTWYDVDYTNLGNKKFISTVNFSHLANGVSGQIHLGENFGGQNDDQVCVQMRGGAEWDMEINYGKDSLRDLLVGLTNGEMQEFFFHSEEESRSLA